MNIVYSYYCLDILHIGHLRYMREAKNIAGSDGKHIAGILTDQAVEEKKSTPILSFEERFEIAQSIKQIDQVIAQRTYSPIENLCRLKPDIVVESTSHNEDYINEIIRITSGFNGEVIILPYYCKASSKKIKNKIRNQ